MTALDPFLYAADVFDPVLSPYYLDPARFAEECIDWQGGAGLNEYQKAELRDLVTHGRLAVRGPHGIGKTTVDAIAVLWFALTREMAGRDWKVLTTADAWRQLEVYLWPEIHKWAKRIRWDVLGCRPFAVGELLDLAIKMTHGEANAVASNNAARIEGAHADSLLYVVDEAKIVPGETWDAIEGAFMNQGAPGIEVFLLANSTPGPPMGRFYDIHTHKPGYEDWHTIHVTLDQAIEAGRITRQAAEQRKRQWGATSAVYLNRVEGEFAASDEDSVIPLAWVEAANERWLELQQQERLLEGELRNVGVDVARFGPDKTVLAVRRKPVRLHGRPVSVIEKLRYFDKRDTMQTAEEIKPYTRYKGVYAVIDVIGIGAGVVDNLRHSPDHDGSAVAFNASHRTEFRDRSGELTFTNKRSAAWWNLRELLDPDSSDPVALPPDDRLTGDLCAPKWRRVAGGRIQVESKDEIRKRLGRSTDSADSVIQACWLEQPDVLDSAGWSAGARSMTGDLLKANF